MFRKVLSVIFIALALLNMLLFALKLITPILFWTVIAIVALFAYLVLPKIKN